ncbi:ABC transporter substrate-binding protein [Agromyces archimandritae]|uniref:ABC transporter substrate-binding protein n=1 Tax=Agromyces archimandritae TaxID=2781962 RepID=A0A975FN11_9MICO|nr:ABC transporter substrate-binding protein [Agromyces archimandritae]QTX04889.1 ABC transporter substrate-binding protein [Agromyces archimandritae]
MTTAKQRLTALAVSAAAALALAGCGTGDPLDGGSTESGGGSIVIGSQDYYSNEIIAELYAQALEAKGFEVDRQLRIGQREVYLPEIEAGNIDLFPEYTGNLLQALDAEATATKSDEVYEALTEALPDGVRVLDQSEASDQDSYNVTAEFAKEHGLTEIGDLADAGVPLVLGGNSELETRPYGPEGLKSVYGVEVSFTPIEDSGGPLTVKALVDGQVQLADIYSADPSIAANDFVTLEDPEGLFLSSNVVPIASDRITDEMAEVIDAVSAALTADDLIALNARSVDDQESAADIAAAWLEEQGLV